MKRAGIATSLVLVVVAAASILASSGAHSAGLQQINLPATTFVGLPKSPHNDNNPNPPDACASQVPLTQGDEHFGDLNASTGSYEEEVQMPNGATVKSFSLFANDFDGTFDVHAYLIRKLITNGTTPKETGYTVMAETASSGAVNTTIRQFTAPSVTGTKVNDAKYMYYVELVVCANTVEPFAAQVVYSI